MLFEVGSEIWTMVVCSDHFAVPLQLGQRYVLRTRQLSEWSGEHFRTAHIDQKLFVSVEHGPQSLDRRPPCTLG